MPEHVITGIGIVSHLGIEASEFFNNLLDSVVINRFEDEAYLGHGKDNKTSRIRSEVKLQIEQEINLYDTTSAIKYGIYAAKRALKDARLDPEIWKQKKVSVILGNNDADPEVFDYYIRHGEFCDKPYTSYNIAKQIADYFDFKGQAFCVHNTCASANAALDLAIISLLNHESDIVLTGGVDSFSLKNYTGFHSLRAISGQDDRPFSKNRDGIVITEGAGIVIVERYEDALKRERAPYCEVLAVGLSNDAHHLTQPNADGIKLAICKALKYASIGFDDVDYIMAHGTGTMTNDKVESSVILELYNGHRMPKICSIKGCVGHMMGAAGAVGLVTICMIFKSGVFPSSPMSLPLDKDCQIDLITEKYRDNHFKIFLNHSFGFGGNNAVAVLKAVDE